mgnify:CR=1 FL=1
MLKANRTREVNTMGATSLTGEDRPMTTTRARPATSGSPRRRLNVNITRSERLGRIVLGTTAFIAAIVLLVSAGSVVAVVLELLLAAAGLDLFATGVVGHCPLYQRLGHTPRSLRSPR